MDTLAHGLWGGAVFGRQSSVSRAWLWAFLIGMAPDLLSFGPFFLTRLTTIFERWGHRYFGPPDPSIIPSYVYHAYNVTHSLVVWAILFVTLWLLRRHIPWIFGAWGLHILCDIPFHSTRFFPTPFLWPFHTPFVNGIPWASFRFMVVNYVLIALAYLRVGRLKPTSAA